VDDYPAPSVAAGPAVDPLPPPGGTGVAVKDELTRAAVEFLGLDLAAVLRWDHDGRELVVRAVSPSGLSGGPVPLEAELERALQSSEPRAPATGTLRALAAALGVPELALGHGLLLPIHGEAGVAGLLVALRGHGRPALEAADIRLLESFARVVALEIALTSERRSAHDARERMVSLVEAGMALAAESSLDALLLRLVQIARQVIGARYAALGVLNADRTELEQFITAGLSDEEVEAIGPLPRGRGILGALIRDARPLRLRRIVDDPRSVGFPANHPPMESFLGVPVALRGHVFGNLYLTEKVGGDFSAEDEQVAQTLAAQAAVAIETARRYEQERRRVAELEGLHELAQALLATLEIGQLLPLLARQARRLTGAETVGVALREGDRLVFRFAHGRGALALESLELPADGAAVAERLREVLGAAAAEVAPLAIAGEQVGVLAAVGARPFDAPARRLLSTFSSHAAIAVANARAFAQERERLLSSAAIQAAQAGERAAAEGHRRAIEAQEAERARIARELHDEAGQVLTALALHLRALEDDLPDKEARERLADLRRQVNAAAASLRDLAVELRPSGLREHGLASAIARHAARVAESSGIEVDLALDGLPEVLDEQTEIALFRVVQEALTNVARHSGSSRASVLASALGERIRVVVEDEGRGFDPGAPTARLGLAGIRERVELIGGELRIESSPGTGTAVIVDLVVSG